MSDGLLFRKVDLHIHTPASKDFVGKCSPKDIVDTAISKGIEVLAVTDHNTGEWIDQLKDAARGTALTIIPGVEITTGDAKVHVLAYFDVTAGSSTIRELLIALGMSEKDFGLQETFCHKSVIEVIDIVTSQRFSGLAVLAHADSSNGVVNVMKGQPRISVIQHKKLSAIEIVNLEKESSFFDGTDWDYKRKIALIQSSDNPAFSVDGKSVIGHGLDGIAARHTFLKLDAPITLEGLRLCFADPDVRIRHSGTYQDFSFPCIQQMTVKGEGFLGGVTARFHTGLNTIVGAKGSGKSLFVEFLRFALSQESQQKDVLADHETKLDVRLGTYSSVEVRFRNEAGKEYTATRVYNPDESSPYDPELSYQISQLFPVLFLSQNEIIKIAENENEQLSFIDRFFDFQTYKAKIRDIENDLKKLDRDFSDSMRATQEQVAINRTIATLNEEIEKLGKQLSNPVFQRYQIVEKKEFALCRQKEFSSTLLEMLAEYKREIDSISTPSVDPTLKDDPLILRIDTLLHGMQNTVREGMDNAATQIKDLQAKVNSEYDVWHPSYQSEKRMYEETVRESGGDLRELEKVRINRAKELEEQNKKLQGIKVKADRLSAIAEKRKERLSALVDIYKQYSEARKAKCVKFEAQSGNRLQIVLHESRNSQLFEQRLGELKRGSYLSAKDIERISSAISPLEFVYDILRYHLSGKQEFLKKISDGSGVVIASIKNLADFLLTEMSYENLLELQYKVLPQDRPIIKFDIGGGRYEPLNRISIGQKCTAMIIMAMCEGNMPVVIDQPEDSLDLRTVWNDMCKKLRIGKEQRQFIFTTHNSSLAVASDTDKFIIMEATADKGKVVGTGALDLPSIKTEIVTYLEGGKPTYQQKADKYNLTKD